MLAEFLPNRQKLCIVACRLTVLRLVVAVLAVVAVVVDDVLVVVVLRAVLPRLHLAVLLLVVLVAEQSLLPDREVREASVVSSCTSVCGFFKLTIKH